MPYAGFSLLKRLPSPRLIFSSQNKIICALMVLLCALVHFFSPRCYDQNHRNYRKSFVSHTVFAPLSSNQTGELSPATNRKLCVETLKLVIYWTISINNNNNVKVPLLADSVVLVGRSSASLYKMWDPPENICLNFVCLQNIGSILIISKQNFFLTVNIFLIIISLKVLHPHHLRI